MPPRLGAREDQQLVGQPSGAQRRLVQPLQRPAHLLGIGLLQGELRLRLDAGERGAQLVRRIGEEAPLRRRRHLQVGKKPIDRAHQRARLAGRRGLVQWMEIAVGAGADLFRESGQRDQPASHPEPHQQQRCCSHAHGRQQHAQHDLATQLIALGHRLGDLDQAGSLAAGSAQSDHPHAFTLEAVFVDDAHAACLHARGRGNGIARYALPVGAAHGVVDVVVGVGTQQLLRLRSQLQHRPAVHHAHAGGQRQGIIGEGLIVGIQGRAQGDAIGSQRADPQHDCKGGHQPRQKRAPDATRHVGRLQSCSRTHARCECGSLPARAWPAGGRRRPRPR